MRNKITGFLSVFFALALCLSAAACSKDNNVPNGNESNPKTGSDNVPAEITSAAVSPDDGNIIFAGGRTGGLIKSTDGGKTWAAVTSFPVTSTDNGNGINAIAFVRNTDTGENTSSLIYVSVSRSGSDNIFMSENGGESWNAVSGLPTDNMMPQRLKTDSRNNLYITYGASEGPSTTGGGGIYRINSSDGSIDNISPADKCFGDIVIDPENTERLVCCTESVWSAQPNGSYGDEFYVSTDGGNSWKCINDDMTMTNGGVEWVSDYAMHWCGSMAIDPYHTDTVLVVSGNGIFRCDNIWNPAPEFTFFVKGLEETVPLECISIPGGELFTAIGDYDGFEHWDITEYGRLHTATIGTTTDIAVAGQNTDVRVKVGGNETSQQILYSENGGDTWTRITNKPDSSTPSYGGSVTVTADGKTIIWSTATYAGAYYTRDRGETWEKAEGLHGGYYVAADTVNPDYVYACGQNGFLVSTDGGKTFTRTTVKLELTGKITVSYGNEGVVYIPCGNAGLFITTDHGENITRLPSLKTCKAIGLGKGKTDNAPYAIYIWGKPNENDTEGIYMSEDNGETWTRINNDAHQFGGLGNGRFIVGDYNIYGRCYMGTVGLGLVYCDKTEK